MEQFINTIKEEQNFINSTKNEEGQTLIEFVLLLVVMMILSFTMLKGINTAVADRWIALIKVVSWPTSTGIDFR